MSRFKVDGLHCKNCVGRVVKAVQGLDPGAEVALDLDSAILTVGRTALSDAAIIAGVVDAGYEATAA